MSNRRSFLQRAFSVGAGLLGARTLAAQQMQMSPGMSMPMRSQPANHAAVKARPVKSGSYLPVITPDVGDLEYTMDGRTKVFHLRAEVVKQTILPGRTLDLWGFNGSSPGPTIQVTEGDHVRVLFENHLPEATSMHWHGFEDRIPFDGMPGISQSLVPPGGSFVYEFDIHQTGTYFYHSHMAMQEMAGMLGGFIMHPKTPYQPHCDKDFLIHLQEYAVLPNSTIPNTMNMEFNWLVLNGKSGPATTPLIVRQGDRVRIRFVNLGMDHHPMHLHGNTFYTTGTEGGRIPEAGWWPGNTVLVGVAQARDVEFVATNPGDWMLHCHLPHHMMNQMSSNVGRMTRSVMGHQPAGVDMESGMGMMQGTPGAPMGDDYGTSLGRGLGFGSTNDMQTSNGAMTAKAMQAMPGMSMGGATPEIAADANSVPNFPQDAFMESPGMAMDAMVERPENYGLRPGWSGFMMGMMNFVRVLSPDTYAEVIGRMREAKRVNDPYAPMLGAATEGRA
ncbi:multicopper oxidase family protein [Granulicella sibirica]|uniref:Multicopper oxidase n=1 Tax=Granulicella sibirica TaxID=2479048 RepID=A0A4Q0T0X4_9BACT|nr:copper oxidase [Granulicella sibirica]RXH55990.1 Multicopper oxidase [Granulicella sibirica]